MIQLPSTFPTFTLRTSFSCTPKSSVSDLDIPISIWLFVLYRSSYMLPILPTILPIIESLSILLFLRGSKPTFAEILSRHSQIKENLSSLSVWCLLFPELYPYFQFAYGNFLSPSQILNCCGYRLHWPFFGVSCPHKALGLASLL